MFQPLNRRRWNSTGLVLFDFLWLISEGLEIRLQAIFRPFRLID